NCLRNFLDSEFNDIRVTHLPGPTKTGDRNRLSVPEGITEQNHAISQSAIILFVAVSQPFGVSEKCGFATATPWCNFVPIG
ncbi:MAG: hypothetical protein AAB288_14060, partial [Acidobacteriota bacterium]